MTKERAMKKAVRDRMDATGEKYTTAMRQIGRDRFEPAELLEARFAPGSVTAIVSGGGLTNFALVMPRLLGFVQAGHSLFVAPHEGRPEPFNMASPFDFITARGLASNQELAGLFASDEAEDRQRLVDLMEQTSEGITFPRQPITEEAWVEALKRSDGSKASVLFVPDLQVDHPLSDWPSGSSKRQLGDFDAMPAQLTGLRSVARRADAIVIGGHCMGSEAESGWRIVSEIVDETIVIEDSDPRTYKMPVRDLRHYRSDDRETVTQSRAHIDSAFSDWRLVYMRQAA